MVVEVFQVKILISNELTPVKTPSTILDSILDTQRLLSISCLTYKELLEINKNVISNNKISKDKNRKFTKEELPMANKHVYKILRLISKGM